ncbi:MAG: hypothetical protein AB1627_17010, partial [Chloroflexota bacterium]
MRVARPDPPPSRPAVAAARVRPGGTRAPRPALLARRAWAGPLAALVIGLATIVPGPAAAAATWSRNLYVGSAFLHQDPWYTACTAAATMTMLNTIAARGTGGPGFTWTPYKVKNNTSDPTDRRDMTSILSFARSRDTLRSTSAGSDPHGWRNALNAYGWGEDAMADPSRMVYQDLAYPGFKGAVKAAVRAIARFGMPVGILGWAGGHAQVMTGYVVSGENPAVSNNFEVRFVYLSDPLRKSWIVNKRLSLEQLRSGSLKFRFQSYRESDSPYDDPYTGDVIRSSVRPTVGPSEWYRRWVIIAPVRSGLPDPAPEPSPGVSPSPTSPPVPSPTPSPDPGGDPSPGLEPSPPAGDATPAPEATPADAAPAEATSAATSTPAP